MDQREPSKFNTAGPGGENTVQAFFFNLLLRDNQPSDPFTPPSNVPSQSSKTSPSSQTPESSGLKGWKQRGCQQENPSPTERSEFPVNSRKVFSLLGFCLHLNAFSLVRTPPKTYGFIVQNGFAPLLVSGNIIENDSGEENKGTCFFQTNHCLLLS